MVSYNMNVHGSIFVRGSFGIILLTTLVLYSHVQFNCG